MNANNRLAVAVTTLCLVAICNLTRATWADESDLSSELRLATKRATEETHLLRYKFAQGETIRWKVQQLGTTEATVRGNTQTSKMLLVSTKQWTVTEVDDEGNATFVHSVADVDMWQKVSGRPEIRYNSQTDEKPPLEYVHVAKTVGVPITTVKVSPNGKVLERDKAPLQANSGLGEIVLPLPVEPVKIGQDWHISNEIHVRRKDGKVLRVKTRLVYTLESVKTGLATISVKTEVVTPVNDPAVKSQLVQQLTNGELKFDVDAGRLVFQQIDWDETVVGFSGDNSLMKYLARFTEELLPVNQTASKPVEPKVR